MSNKHDKSKTPSNTMSLKNVCKNRNKINKFQTFLRLYEVQNNNRYQLIMKRILYLKKLPLEKLIFGVSNGFEKRNI